MITGIIGAITGIAGFAMGYVSLRRTRGMKALDLRLELLKAEADVRAISSSLPALLERADKSRKAVAAFEGSLDSGAMSITWKNELMADNAKVRALVTRIPAQSDYRGLPPEQLEPRIIAIHGLRTELDQIQEKYNSALAKDERKRS
jgi:hypothetical protein